MRSYDDDFVNTICASVASLEKRVAELEDVIAQAGGQQREDGEWVWPYYIHKAPPVMMPTDQWQKARKTAAAMQFCFDEISDD